jgi:hypothetical protein
MATYTGGNVNILISDVNGQTVRPSSPQLIGWWGLFDTGEVWECGPAFLVNLYAQPFSSLSGISGALLGNSANQSITS